MINIKIISISAATFAFNPAIRVNCALCPISVVLFCFVGLRDQLFSAGRRVSATDFGRLLNNEVYAPEYLVYSYLYFSLLCLVLFNRLRNRKNTKLGHFVV